MPPATESFAADQSAQPKNPLREEIALLGDILGQTVVSLAGEKSLELVEELRLLAWERRKEDNTVGSELTELIAGLDNAQLRIVIRAFTIFLDLANVAEDRHRVRVLRQRDREKYPHPRSESVRAAVQELADSGIDSSGMQDLVNRLDIDLVFTSHPTEAKRRSVRRKLRRLHELLSQLESDQVPSERDQTVDLVRTEVAKLWHTDFIRPWKPSVLEEVQRGLSIKPVLWEVVPQIIQDLRGSLAEQYPDNAPQVTPCVRFGSWMGGDRDGHPGVTPDITEQTIGWLRETALDFQIKQCRELFRSLSLSDRQLEFGPELQESVSKAAQRWPELASELESISPNEQCRHWLRIILWRLNQTKKITLDQWQVEGSYTEADELNRDVSTLLKAVQDSTAVSSVNNEIQLWQDRIETFGFHLARLDVRQDARIYEQVMNEMLKAAGLSEKPADLSFQQRQELLVATLDRRIQIPTEQLSEMPRRVVELFQLLHRIDRAFGIGVLGGHVISMTRAASDVLTVLWLWKHSYLNPLLSEKGEGEELPIVPLLETIDDLKNGPQILDEMLSLPVYREYLRQQGDRQMIMLGYSDSTKDGGYASACWSLYLAQRELQQVAEKHGIELTFFHGRGGSLGRGGGPAARSIRSLPQGSFTGALRITEQGEVLADRYDNPQIAHRHLEQLVWSSLLACGKPAGDVEEPWLDAMRQISQGSLETYRQLVEQNGFVEFFRTATPISEIEQLPIGSRPSRRTGGQTLSDLRAIPWVFSWTQCRCLIPAWFGLGSALQNFQQQPESAELLKEMYAQWPFFRAMIDNAELAIAKADLDIAERYAELAEESESATAIQQIITAEYHRTREALLTITGQDDLLDGIEWLKESIRVRNRYIDPLNLIQIELLRRIRSCPAEDPQVDDLRNLARLTINGLAAGMRTSG